METLEFVKSEIRNKLERLAAKYDTTIMELDFGNLEFIFLHENKTTLEFCFDGYYTFSDDKKAKERSIGYQFTCAYKTPKGYISTKKIPVNVKDSNNVTLEEAGELLKFNTDAVKNTFDPFWSENEAKRKNAAAWNYIAKNHLQPDVDSF